MTKAKPRLTEPDRGTWRGVPTYICRVCGYSTTHEDTFTAHIAFRHPGIDDQNETEQEVTDGDSGD